MATAARNLAKSISGAEEVKAAIKSVPVRARSRGLWLALGEEIKAQTEERFDLGEEPSGKKWPTSWRVKMGLGGGPTLVNTGDMRRSMTVNATDAGGELVVPKVYAATHQFGATINHKRVLNFFANEDGTLKAGFAKKKDSNFAKRVDAKSTIPARPFLGFSLRNIEAIQQVAADYVTLLGQSQGTTP